MSILNADFVPFFKELEQHNAKEWFDVNRLRYEKNIKKPFEEFVSAVIDAVNKIDDAVILKPSQAIFRINKDIRFSKDKSPYKLNRSAIISPFGTKNKVYPGLYFELNAQSLSIYSGAYSLDTKQISQVREDIVDYFEDFDGIIKSKNFVKTFGAIKGDKSIRVPKGFQDFAKDHPVVLNKNFYVVAQYPISKVFENNVIDFIANHYKVAKPFNDFLARAITGVTEG